MGASLGRAQAGPGDEVVDHPGDQDLAGVGTGLDPRCHVDGHTGDVAGGQFAFPGVEAGANLQSETAEAVSDGPGALHRPRGGIERDEKAVASALYLAAPEELYLAPNEGIVLGQQGVPAGVAQ